MGWRLTRSQSLHLPNAPFPNHFHKYKSSIYFGVPGIICKADFFLPHYKRCAAGSAQSRQRESIGAVTVFFIPRRNGSIKQLNSQQTGGREGEGGGEEGDGD